MPRTRNAGFEITIPEKACTDKKCPFHGNLKTRGRQFTGKVVSEKMQHTVVVEWEGWRYIPKYERYKRTRTKILAHNTPCINAAEGDMVLIAECRPLSKKKNFVVLKVLGKLEKYALEKEAMEEAKHKAKAAEIENLAKQEAAAKSKDKGE